MTRWLHRLGARVLVVPVAAIALSACGATASGSPPVADVSTTAAAPGGATASTVPKHNAAQSLVEWAACMRRHGDPSQPDPTIDSHGGIDIIIPESAESLSHAVHDGTAPCNAYLSAASAALRAGAADLTPPDEASLVRYAQCMRASGVPNYPDPSSNGESDFNGTGIDPNSPLFVHANDVCGTKIHAPSWWISGDGPPGNISIRSGPMCGTSVCTPAANGSLRQTTGPGTGG